MKNDTEKSYQVHKERGCTLIRGSIPIDDFVRLSRQVSPDDPLTDDFILSPSLAMLSGSSVAWGAEADCRALEREYAGRHGDILEATYSGAIQPEAITWVRYGEIGASAIALFWRIAGCPPFPVPDKYQTSCPQDTYDLRRCRLLLDNVPGWAARLSDMNEVSPGWELLVQEWPNLCAAMDQENPEWRTRTTQNQSLGYLLSLKSADHETPSC